MNTAFDTVYPDFLRTGLVKLKEVGAQRELMALFAALEHFRRDLHGQENPVHILEITQRYLDGLNLFAAMGFWLVDPADMSFTPAFGSPEDQRATLQQVIDCQIKSGRFAAAVKQATPVFFDPVPSGGSGRGVLHSLALSGLVTGMFCGILRENVGAAPEIAFTLLSLFLGGSADALATLRRTRQLTNQIETLSGLMPLCAWCKKVRNDSGYWEQIEQYLSEHSSASITHGVCPECRKKLLEKAAAKSKG